MGEGLGTRLLVHTLAFVHVFSISVGWKTGFLLPFKLSLSHKVVFVYAWGKEYCIHVILGFHMKTSMYMHTARLESIH